MLRLAPLVLIALPVMAQADTVTVFAAASLKTAFDTIAPDWKAQSGDDLVISYAGSSVLAQQIIQGAPTDVFISASTDWMDAVDEAGVTIMGTRRDLLGNTLVLVAATDAPETTIERLPDALSGGKLAMALVDSVPAGVYGQEALRTLGLWDHVRADVAQADNVRAALALVAAGEAPYGIVYASDAVAEPAVRVVATFPEDSHTPITYPAAVIRGTHPEAAEAFLTYLSQPAAGAVFADQGFKVLP
ncbi:molybdate ABC transporter substrate-binding protein [Falsirhodobacter halotolerans]|uniref:molybdate ABC transporter substrate-binding protein n=1 Tax=Falsirhodobacter halotolerans TaxID=1146892 RepID=UPI001FD1DAE3|nr:molybdate ABC transporter substrate-binding protein [Falsirhodobacter halotolerans]MCJ8139209.1 molybdate ABC transporter substrate-binding protein [Falsirhodobacter halotolerans]